MIFFEESPTIFYLDKDVDDFTRTLRWSDHVVYTDAYEIENYLFMYGDIGLAAAQAAGLDARSVIDGIGDYARWRIRVTDAWRDWVKICLYSITHRIREVATYRLNTSPINERASADVDDAKYKRIYRLLKNASGLPAGSFDRSFNRLSRKVDNIYSANEFDRVFKGKWYVHFLVHDTKRIAGRRKITTKNLEKLILCALTGTLNFDDSWASEFRQPVRELIARCRI